ncbi:MAG: chemotaxis protein CheX [Clostridiales bacterium]|nr:chemotaxis protein CheX [Clostridiales bacterium]
MFCRFFGNYLLGKNIITDQQLEEILDYRKNNRVKLGLIAVEQNMLTPARADEVNRLQMKMDKRFGDIAVEKGYLTESDIAKLLQLQGNPYLMFVQAASEKGILTKEIIDANLVCFQKDNSFSDGQMAVLKNGDLDQVVSFIIKVEKPYDSLVALALKNIVRFASTDLAVGTLTRENKVKANHIGLQSLNGDHEIMLALACDEEELLTIASPFGKEDFECVNVDAMDAICEFINCTNGLFASKLSQDGIELDMLPPQFYETSTLSTEGEFYVLPIQVCGQWVKLILSVNASWNIN